MATPYIGEIRIFAANWAPVDWHLCDGGLLPISQYGALYNLIGTTYGGDGNTTFAVPDLRSRVPLHFGTDPQSGPTYSIGAPGGFETITLTVTQLPSHSHTVSATTSGQTLAPSSNTLPAQAVSSQQGSMNVYKSVAPGTKLNPATVKNEGGSGPHNNIQPYLAVNFIIALNGIFPTRQ